MTDRRYRRCGEGGFEVIEDMVTAELVVLSAIEREVLLLEAPAESKVRQPRNPRRLS